MDDPERHRRGAYHTGAAFERGDVHRQHGVERVPGVEPVDAQLDDDVSTVPRIGGNGGGRQRGIAAFLAGAGSAVDDDVRPEREERQPAARDRRRRGQLHSKVRYLR
jgi:hypothetical protein